MNDIKPTYGKYIIVGYDVKALEDCGGDVRWITGYSGEREEETLKGAKKAAKYLISEEYRISGGMSERHAYAAVHNKAGECVHEEFNSQFSFV